MNQINYRVLIYRYRFQKSREAGFLDAPKRL